MDTSIFFGGSVVAAAVAGSIALFAPCCISVMLPAYFAGSFQNRRLLVAMTFLFAAGVATVILPIAMGAAVLRRLLTTEHTAIYVAGGLLMLALAAYTLLGGQIHLPMPGRRAGGRAGPASVYSLGVFSGVASSCCAPVLAGVVALSGVASSFGLALGLGTAYVFGMVAPLFAISLLWERFDWRSSRLFRPRSFTWRLGPLRRTLTATNLASGLLLAVMGAATVWIGIASDAMPASTGWQATLAVRLQHYGQVITDALSWVPGWAGALALLVVVGLLAWRALGQVGWTLRRADEIEEQPETKEETLERRHA
ncbi:MAG: cytochrome c biogenesis CcdA family protein [Chloroflexota bacterium]|nr:cytochrome c biogenesis CcdA family protein [Chloroflexota bacterium]